MFVFVNFNTGELRTDPSLSALISDIILGKFNKFSKLLLLELFPPNSNKDKNVTAFFVRVKGVLGVKSCVFKSNLAECVLPVTEPKVYVKKWFLLLKSKNVEKLLVVVDGEIKLCCRLIP